MSTLNLLISKLRTKLPALLGCCKNAWKVSRAMSRYTTQLLTAWNRVVITMLLLRCVMLSRFSHVWLFATLVHLASQAPLSIGFLQARILVWVAVPSSRGSSWPREQTLLCLQHWQVGSLPPGKPMFLLPMTYWVQMSWDNCYPGWFFPSNMKQDQKESGRTEKVRKEGGWVI